jgi:hypothetical protein
MRSDVELAWIKDVEGRVLVDVPIPFEDGTGQQFWLAPNDARTLATGLIHAANSADKLLHQSEPQPTTGRSKQSKSRP